MKIVHNDKEYMINEGDKVIDVLKEQIDAAPNEIMACLCNNEVRSLNLKLKEDSTIRLLDITTKDGIKVYKRGLMFIMGMAFQELYPDALITVNYQLSNAMFCELDNMKITKEMLEKVKERMIEIVNSNLTIEKVKMTKEEAEEFYEKEKTKKGKIQIHVGEKYGVSLYYCGDYYNYFYGVMPIKTGVIKMFDLEKYRDGYLVRYPSRKTPNELGEFIENKKLVTTMDEYEDIHKILGINTIEKLNRKIDENKANQCITLDEALHEKKVAGIADKIAKNRNVKMVLIAGPSSSGKTTFAQRLDIHLRLNKLKPITISVDNYFVEREDNPKDEKGNYNFECIEAIDLNLFNEHLLKLLNGEEIKVPTFDFIKGTKIYKGNTMKLEPDSVLVIEGIHCLNDKLTNKIPSEQKFKIYISALTVLNMDYYNRISTTDTRLVRRIVRDYLFRGYSALHTLRMWDSVNRGEEKNIFPFQEEADAMFNSSLIYELAVLKNYAIPLLEEIKQEEPEYAEAKRLVRFLSYFKTIPADNIPPYSLLKEFIGGSIFE